MIVMTPSNSFSQNISIHSFLQSISQVINYCNVFIVPKIKEATKIMFVIFTLLYDPNEHFCTIDRIVSLVSQVSFNTHSNIKI